MTDQTTKKKDASGQCASTVGLGLVERLRSTNTMYGWVNRQAQEAADEIELLSSAIIAMAEDGWLYHGVEGMDDVQKQCYEAYLRVKPNVKLSTSRQREEKP